MVKVDQPIDVTAEERETLLMLIERYLPDTEVWVYGSRVLWTSRPQSDLDMVVFTTLGQEGAVSDLRDAFEESDLPFRVDLFVWDEVPDSFQRQIKRDHVVLTSRPIGVRRWCRVILGDCIMMNEATYSPKEKWSFVNYLDTGNITSNRIKEIQYLDLNEAKLPSRARRKAELGDIVFSTVRPNQRHFGILQFVPDNFLVSTGFAVIRARDEIADTGFIYSFLTQDQIVDQLHTIAEQSTSAYPSIRPADIRELNIDLPPIREQRAIAQILGTLGQKIELNRRMNQTLEAMARALFQHWFVDFGPVRAKMEGRDTGLPKEIANLFPDRLVDSDLGEIPDGWQVKTLGDLCKRSQYGYTASARSEPVGPRFLRITDINKDSWVSWSRVPYCRLTENEFTKYRLNKGDFLIARMADPGHGILVEEDVNAVFASYLIRFRPLDDFNARILQYWLRSDAYWQLVNSQGAGTTRVSLNARVLGQFSLVVPPENIANVFGDVIGAFRDRVVQCATEMQLLAGIRDALLPKLVSGEIRISAAENLVGELA